MEELREFFLDETWLRIVGCSSWMIKRGTSSPPKEVHNLLIFK